MTQTKRGPYKNGIVRRRQILDKAVEVFGTYGYLAGSLRQIAAEVGVTPAALARHFDSKEDLLVEVLRYWENDNAHRTAGAEPTGVAALRDLTDLMEYHLRHRGFLQLFLTLGVEATNPDHPARQFIVERYASTREGFAKRIQDAIDAGELMPLPPEQVQSEARLLIAALDGFELQWLLDPDFDLVSEVDRFIEATIRRLEGTPRLPVDK
ncbi:TetR/AcrR family transcriptional regulator [Agromyces protaetiae]|uniref:TetR/AcrR family transcriptional regulator n=1 Tax=Agromyces protaetiae TaxID=2509455 RepID=A0A4P6F9H2_9MICO|nr:TetR/AcrR family transcriptional regulator [Agromyces protaetiae]QAY72245.1 TetR/AcrR family transcriptional regulator [Agromyces protaetiae]